MKKILLLFALIITGSGLYAQTADKYVKAMENLVPAIDTTRNIDGLTELAGAFQRIADAEKIQWLPYYYAALCYVNQANLLFVDNKTDQIDPLLDKAEPMIAKAEELQKNNSEIYCLRKMYNTGRMMVDPMNRYMTYMTPASEALAMAKELNPENPRVYLLEGQDKFYTPEQYGGSKSEAKTLFEEALKKYEVFRPESSIHPNWGRNIVSYHLSQLK